MIAAQATQAGLIGAAFTKHRNHRAMTTVSNAFPAVSLTLSQIESHACNKDSPVLPSWHCLATLDFAYDKKMFNQNLIMYFRRQVAMTFWRSCEDQTLWSCSFACAWESKETSERTTYHISESSSKVSVAATALFPPTIEMFKGIRQLCVHIGSTKPFQSASQQYLHVPQWIVAWAISRFKTGHWQINALPHDL